MNNTKIFTNKAIEVFPIYTLKGDYLFRLLEDAYVQARYNKDFIVTKANIDKLLPKFEQLKINTLEFCTQKIEEYSLRIKD